MTKSEAKHVQSRKLVVKFSYLIWYIRIMFLILWYVEVI
jgi:hypothetical protein